MTNDESNEQNDANDEQEQRNYDPHKCCLPGCPARGVLSSSTSGQGPWYCPWHWREPYGPEAERITEDLRRPGALQKAIERRYGPYPRRPTDETVENTVRRDFPNQPGAWRHN